MEIEELINKIKEVRKQYYKLSDEVDKILPDNIFGIAEDYFSITITDLKELLNKKE